MNFLPIAASDMDIVIGIIAVVGWILAQIFGRKKSGAPSETPPQESTRPANPQDELRKFFEEMEKNLNPQAEPKPVAPPPPPVPSPRRHIHFKSEKMHSRAYEPIPTHDVPVVTAREAAQAFMEASPQSPATVPLMTATLAPRPPIEGIRDPWALRKMIVTMEVLGKPVALR